MPSLSPWSLAALLGALAPAALMAEPASTPSPVLNAQAQHAHWSGIGRLTMDNGRLCIATLIDSRDNPPTTDSGPAYILTSGHCVDTRNGRIGQDQPTHGSIAFNYFIDTQEQRKTFALKRSLWNSMQGTDLALLELDATLDEVMSQGIMPLRMGSNPAKEKPVVVIGEPSSIGKGLRVASCTEHPADFALEHPWVWRNIRVNDCPGVSAGASGSPVITPDDQQVIAVINSVTSDASAPCATNSPCVNAQGSQDAPPRNIAMPLNRVLGCFKQGVADLALDSCQLLPGFSATVTKRPRFLEKIASDEQGQYTPPGWNLHFTLDTPRYRFKTTTDPLACEEPTGYSGTIAAGEVPIDAPVGPEPGWHFLCLIGVNTPEQAPSFALMANSLTLATELLPAKDVPFPDVTYAYQDNGGVRVTWTRHPPDVVHYRVKQGPAAKIDCDDPKGFGLLRHTHFTFEASKLPLKICTRGEDIIRQQSAVRTDVIASVAR
ncbi:trypsin-like peptidase domain-containing protein [uncultured Pseudomonas sp.]|uniref:trypsin-like serine peptidase n=1 Tax=uncultured Pseudomonas sp. TaxID=114707 RepID=UPI0025849A3F|nr:trypsin-like peptidase domain-containing protein [uncultured Pseudomonas sp.]